ncbi:MAG: LptF/LptG family permease, partial [Natronospirillum sp.]
RSASSLTALWNSNSLYDKTEAQQRIIYPLSILVFAFWAVTLTRYNPRARNNAAILPAIVFYVLFMYFTRTLNASVRSGALPLWANFWWLQIAAVLMAVMLRSLVFARLMESVRRRIPSWRRSA